MEKLRYSLWKIIYAGTVSHKIKNKRKTKPRGKGVLTGDMYEKKMSFDNFTRDVKWANL